MAGYTRKLTKGMELLELTNVSKSFGGVQAVAGLSFSLAEREILGLIGPNGAGKSTVFNLITGMAKTDSGTILFGGADISRLPTYRICRLGVARTFQLVRTFNRLTVEENIVAGRAYGSEPARKMKKAREEAGSVMELTGLADKRNLPGASLGLIDRKRLEIARALATRPRLLLLDEMFAGLNASEMDDAIDMVRRIRESGITLIVVEHVMKVIMAISDRVVVMAIGAKIADGLPGDVIREESVIKAYLGKRKRS